MQLDVARSRKRGVSLTPLIDVVFILLLFFMLSTKFDQQRAMQVDVPVTASGAAASERAELLLEMTAGGRISLMGQRAIELRKLASHALIAAARKEQTPVVVVVNDAASLQMLTDVMDVLSTLNLPAVSVRGLS